MIPAALTKILFPHPTRLSLAAAGLLLALGFAVMMPGLFSLPPIERDEARFAQSTRQMVETGNYTDIHFQDKTRYSKPIGIYWMQAGVVKLAQVLGLEKAPRVIGLYRMPSLLAALLAVILTAMIGARLCGARVGFIAGCLLSTCLLLNVEARLAKTDAVLLCCTLACMLVLAKAYMRAGLPQPLKLKDFLLFWIALGVGLLVKGPVILLAVAGAPLVLRLRGEKSDWLKPLKPAFGVPLALLITLPWFIAITVQTGDGFIKDSAGRDLLDKIWDKPNWSGTPPGYHVLMSWIAMWPASLPVWLALPWLWQSRRNPPLRFLLAWIVPVWITFEIVFAKLPHYVLPAYPALMIAAACWLSNKEHEGRPPHWWRTTALVIFGLVSIVLCLFPAILPVFAEDQIFFFPIFFLGLALGLSLAAVQLLRRDQRRLTPWPLALAGGILAFALFRFLFLDMPSVFISARLAEKMQPPGDCVKTTLATAGFREPSLVFLTNAQVRFLFTGEDVALALTADRCLTAAVEKEQINSFNETLERLGARADKIGEIKGLNYANGKHVEITVYQAER